MQNLDVATVSSGKSEGGLSRRAFLTFLNRIFLELGKIAVMFVARPIIILTLGGNLYGAWVIIQQMANYMVVGDLNPTKALRLSLSVRQHIDDFREKKRYIGAALLVWLGSLPVVLALGVTIVWLTPSMIKSMSADEVMAVKVAIVIFVVSVGLTRVLAIPGNVLRGANLEYKAMGLEAGVAILGGLLSVAAVINGYSLPGLATAHLIVILLGASVYFFVAKRTLPWFGLEWPRLSELLKFTQLSGWVFVTNLGWMTLHSTSLIILGITMGPKAVTIYVTTKTALMVSERFIHQFVTSTYPAISGICGEEKWPFLLRARGEIFELLIGITVIFGSCVLVLNEPFLLLWIGEEGFYAGYLTTFLFVLMSFQMPLYRIEAHILESMFQFRSKVIGTFIFGIFIMGAGYIFSSIWGLPGMAAAVFLGRLGLMFYFSVLLSAQTQAPLKDLFLPILRPTVTAVVLIVGVHFISSTFRPATWLSFISAAMVLFVLSSGFVWVFGFRKKSRELLSKRFFSLFQDFYLQKQAG